MIIRKALPGLLLLALVVGSCGGDTDTEDATTTVPEAGAAVTTIARDASASSTTARDASTAAGGTWVGVAPPTASMSDEDAAALDAAAAAGIEEGAGQLPGMWIGVWDPEKGVHLGAYGEAVVAGAAATIDDKGRIASITKTFTAAAILEQIAAGSLSLDDTVADVLPELAAELPEIADITVEQLLSMQSGIPEFEFRVVNEVLADPTAIVDLHDVIISTVNEQGVSPPGTPGYSTTNYLILGEVLTALTGEPVEDVLNGLAQEVGLENTALQPADEFGMPAPASAGYVNAFAAEGLQSQGVEVEPLGDVSAYTATWAGAGGSMYSTVEDLGRWAATGFGNSLLPADLGDRRLESDSIPEGDYGLGIFDYGNGWHGHTGEILGWNSLTVYQPETGAVFVALVNESGSLLATAAPALAAFPDITGAYGLE